MASRSNAATAFERLRETPAVEVMPGKHASDTAQQLDRLIHERMRLGIVSALAANEVLSFTELKRLLETTDGNVSVHARKLEEAGYVSCQKSFEGRMPKTEYRLTNTGRAALEKYLNHLEALLQAMRPK